MKKNFGIPEPAKTEFKPNYTLFVRGSMFYLTARTLLNNKKKEITLEYYPISWNGKRMYHAYENKNHEETYEIKGLENIDKIFFFLRNQEDDKNKCQFDITNLLEIKVIGKNALKLELSDLFTKNIVKES